MIPLFRKIRYRLAKENQFFKYSRYAIGEIVLVVIGILIAIQINNWNQKRINHNILTIHLQGVKWDLKNDSIAINAKIKELELTNVRTKIFLNHPDYNTFTIDSLEKSLETFTKDIPIMDKSFQQIQNSNITNYGAYKETIELAQWFYSIYIPLLMDNTDGHLRDIERQDNFWRYQQTSYEMHYFDDLKSYQSDHEAKAALINLLKSPIPRNILKIDYRRNKEWIKRYQLILIENKALREQINNGMRY